MKRRNLIIFGSSRKHGNTADVVNHLAPLIDAEVINLHGLDISYYDYDNQNASDDFIGIVRQMANYEQIIFATPVYWYSMSAPLKTFFDRFSDLIRVEKQLGRSLQGKRVFAMSCGSYDEVVEGFEIPFKKSAEYMHLEFGGYAHVWKDGKGIEDKVKNILLDFSQSINKH